MSFSNDITNVSLPAVESGVCLQSLVVSSGTNPKTDRALNRAANYMRQDDRLHDADDLGRNRVWRECATLSR